ncbi:hypothetical protein C4K27_4735 [Pseudomonas chlororaphis subsp. chlororaphis]|nr:hypothetical protein C4K27_4735 [Pseudomonas chlororaphis subsp. chlororaphis]
MILCGTTKANARKRQPTIIFSAMNYTAQCSFSRLQQTRD